MWFLVNFAVWVIIACAQALDGWEVADSCLLPLRTLPTSCVLVHGRTWWWESPFDVCTFGMRSTGGNLQTGSSSLLGNRCASLFRRTSTKGVRCARDLFRLVAAWSFWERSRSLVVCLADHHSIFTCHWRGVNRFPWLNHETLKLAHSMLISSLSSFDVDLLFSGSILVQLSWGCVGYCGFLELVISAIFLIVVAPSPWLPHIICGV